MILEENFNIEGTVSQISDLSTSLSFYLMKPRTIIMKNDKDLPVFCQRIKTMTYITISRHDSLWINILIMQVHIVDSKRDILDPKIKVKNDHSSLSLKEFHVLLDTEFTLNYLELLL